MQFNVVLICVYFELQKGYRSLHTAARKDFAKAAKLLLQKDHKPDVEAPVSWFKFIFLSLLAPIIASKAAFKLLFP